MTNEEFLRSISLDGEEWRPSVGWEDYYAVSNLGRVASFERYVVGSRRKCMRFNKARVLSPRKTKTYNGGYYAVELKNDGEIQREYVHRLVAIHFIPNEDPTKCEVDHINCNTLDNRVLNLRWASHAENQNNKNTLSKFRESHINQPIPSRWIPIVGVMGENVINYKTLKDAKQDGFHPSAICRCCKGKQLNHKGYRWMYLSDYENLKSAMSKNSLES